MTSHLAQEFHSVAVDGSRGFPLLLQQKTTTVLVGAYLAAFLSAVASAAAAPHQVFVTYIIIISISMSIYFVQTSIAIQESDKRTGQQGILLLLLTEVKAVQQTNWKELRVQTSTKAENNSCTWKNKRLYYTTLFTVTW